jgi:hypothetical protein
MMMIQSHLIANLPVTPVYQGPSAEGQPIATVAKGSWLGVIKREGDWIQIIGIDCEGWVKKADVEALPPLTLHVVWTPGKPIAYMHLPHAS